MKNYAWLVNTGHNAVKSLSSGTKTIVHLAGGDDNALYVWNIGGLINNGANFDMIAMSLYPSASGWNTAVTNTVNNAKDMINRYGKEIIISEIGMDNNQAAAGKVLLPR